MVEESSQWQGFSPGGALGGPESGRVAVGSVRPHAPTWSCDAAGLPELPGTSPVPAPQACPAPGQEGWVGSPRYGRWRNHVRVPGEQGAPVASGGMSSQGGPHGRGPGQEWMQGVAQVGPARDPGAIEFLLPAMGGSVLQLHPPALTPAPSMEGQRGRVCRPVHA